MRSGKHAAKSGLAGEYRFAYSKSKANRFSRRVGRTVTVIVLDSDVAAVFRDSKKVNAALRATMTAKQKRGSRGAS